MSYTVSLTNQANEELRGIYEYIAYSLNAPQSAKKQIDRIVSSLQSLDTMPERFRLYDNEPWKSRELRIMPVDNYLVFYFVQHEELAVKVIRIMYGRRDIDRQLSLSSEL